jgi:hypothetical protein
MDMISQETTSLNLLSAAVTGPIFGRSQSGHGVQNIDQDNIVHDLLLSAWGAIAPFTHYWADFRHPYPFLFSLFRLKLDLDYWPYRADTDDRYRPVTLQVVSALRSALRYR